MFNIYIFTNTISKTMTTLSRSHHSFGAFKLGEHTVVFPPFLSSKRGVFPARSTDLLLQHEVLFE